MTPGEVWASSHRPIEKYLRRSLKLSRSDAEEIVAEAAATLLRSEAYPSRELLAKVARDKAIDMIRMRDRRIEIEEKIAPLLEGRAIPTIEGAMFRADFDRAFRRLPEDEAKAFALTELRGLTERETAEVLGVSQKTINRRCEAARTYLKEALS